MKIKRVLTIVMAMIIVFSLAGISSAVEGKMGDVDGNEQVTAADAAGILRAVVRLQNFTYTQEVLGDVDHSGEITAADASHLLRYIVHLEEKAEKVFEQEEGDFRFIPENNLAQITKYIGNEETIIIPSSLTGHPVNALAEGSFEGVVAEAIYFPSVPPIGFMEAGISTDIIIFYPIAAEDSWLAGDINGYTTQSYLTQQVTFSVSGLNPTYNGQPASILATPSIAGVPYSITYKQNGVAVTPINAGVYNYEIRITDSNYYATGENLEGELVIEKATYDMSGITFVDKVGRQDNQNELQYFSIEITGTLPAGVTVSYWLGNNPFVPQSEKGVYTVTAKFSGDAVNYNPIADMTAKLTVEDPWSPGWLSF